MVSGNKCMAKNCTNHYSSNSSYFKFPKDLKMRKIWFMNCRSIKDVHMNKTMLTKSENWRLCKKHFENRMFVNINRMNRLTHFAYPTLFEDQSSDSLIITTESSNSLSITTESSNSLGINTESSDSLGIKTESSDSSVVEPGTLILSFIKTGSSLDLLQTDTSNALLKTIHLASGSQTPLHLVHNTSRQLELEKELELANKRIKELEKTSEHLNNSLVWNNSAESLLNYCRQFLPENLFIIVKYHIMSVHRKKNGCRYPKEMKEFASTIYNTSPKVYRFLQGKISLPNITTFKKSH